VAVGERQAEGYYEAGSKDEAERVNNRIRLLVRQTSGKLNVRRRWNIKSQD
jgi:hypothetical protein